MTDRIGVLLCFYVFCFWGHEWWADVFLFFLGHEWWADVFLFFLGHEWWAERLITKCYRVQKWWHHKTLCLHFSVLDTMYKLSMMKNIYSPNLVGIGSRGPEIWLHEYLISPIKISVNWPGSKQLWTRPIYTNFHGAYLLGIHAAVWTNSCQIWCVRVFHHVLLKYGHENAEMKKKMMTPHFTTVYLERHHSMSWKKVQLREHFMLMATGFQDCLKTLRLSCCSWAAALSRNAAACLHQSVLDHRRAGDLTLTGANSSIFSKNPVLKRVMLVIVRIEILGQTKERKLI